MRLVCLFVFTSCHSLSSREAVWPPGDAQGSGFKPSVFICLKQAPPWVQLTLSLSYLGLSSKQPSHTLLCFIIRLVPSLFVWAQHLSPEMQWLGEMEKDEWDRLGNGRESR